ncbi:hypothetical protein JB92DRAFT_3115726 [Gautieria morchelliformis]|nr:hypothetical protein JB92DRAFT_3115726 [Gautieria morchelliformis]
MFAQVFVAVLALVSFAQAAITIGGLNIKGNSSNTITWTSSDTSTDPESFSIELINQVFNSQFALANNIPTTQGSITFQLPVVAPGPGYTVEFVNPGNINDIFATSAPFSVQENDVSSSSAASATGVSSSAVGVSSLTSALTTAGSLTQTGVSATGTAPLSVSSASSAGASSSAASSTSASPTPNGAMGLVPSGSFAAIIAGVIALVF